MMVDIQDTSLHYFIYVCIARASSVSTATCTDHHVFMVSFLSEMNYFVTLVGLFFHTLFHLSKISMQMFY